MKQVSPKTTGQIPPRLDYLAGMSWRILTIIAMLAVLIFVIIQLNIIVIPLLVALLVTALLFPFVQWMVHKGIKKGLAVAISLFALIVIISLLVFVVSQQVRSAYPALREQSIASFNGTMETLSREPFNINTRDLASYGESVSTYIQDNASVFLTGVSSVGSAAGHVFTGVFLAFFAVIFFLLDGKNIWRWLVNLFPSSSRQKLSTAGTKGWRTLMSFVKSQIAVAGVDAVGIGLGAFILQVPLAIPIAVVVFLGSFIPVVGAIITGAIAVVLALIFNGWISALLMLGVVLLVQLVEGHVLQPFLIGKAVKIHPLAIVLAVAIGSLLAGIPGALFAVPILAVLNVVLSSLLADT